MAVALSDSGKSMDARAKKRSRGLCFFLWGGGREAQYGGQAVIEGVMMRGPRKTAVAIRRPSGEVLVESEPNASVTARYPFLKLPLLRGVVALFESLILGIRYLTFSANQAMEEEEEELSTRDLVLTVAFALAVAVGFFVLLPAGAALVLRNHLSIFWQNVVEGFLRMLLFLGYVAAIGRVKDIQRVFQYHGAEHKVINALEAGEELRVETVRPYPTLHPRCGTSFLLLVLVLTIVFFSLVGRGGIAWRLASRLVLLPVVAGLAYELLKFTGRHLDVFWVRVIAAPGLWLQKLTTREPDDGMLEVALAALAAARDDGEKNDPGAGDTGSR
ncbi:predicted metal-dependent enzyme [Moorella thermoacetica Y72]|uniref:Predicted metal-dependent enzyme n=2 Tax=Neomoorella thermoacetica TaxID=1525 RepID=A0A0S6UF43_NEOTH|nr:DUF1385 domain-containing protein [Moorella thermoacetica]OIQ62480.1 hypothetical protein MTIN_07200 [Moorella thermoacetica]GAF25627.1 predicted metal-dependent enzyme [Moorella thermoacetica Y72]